MSFNYEDYCQYLLSSHTNYTLTHLGEHRQKISHDTINRYLRNEKLTTSLLWQNIKLALKEFQEG
jgi:cysteinyl-tRNA synthetase